MKTSLKFKILLIYYWEYPLRDLIAPSSHDIKKIHASLYGKFIAIITFQFTLINYSTINDPLIDFQYYYG